LVPLRRRQGREQRDAHDLSQFDAENTLDKQVVEERAVFGSGAFIQV